MSAEEVALLDWRQRSLFDSAVWLERKAAEPKESVVTRLMSLTSAAANYAKAGNPDYALSLLADSAPDLVAKLPTVQWREDWKQRLVDCFDDIASGKPTQ